MLTQPDQSERDDAIEAVRAFITAGNYTPGDRLPSERELINDLGMSRATLRKALESLEREGAIWRHVGKGTFVASQGVGSPANALADLSRQINPVRMMRARLCIEPAIAREAAIYASTEALNRIKLARDRAAKASNWDDYEIQDHLFHRAIAEASDNILLLTLFDQLDQVRRAVGWVNVVRKSIRPPEDHSSFIEHNKIIAALEARDPEATQAAMRQHLRSVMARLFGEA